MAEYGRSRAITLQKEAVQNDLCTAFFMLSSRFAYSRVTARRGEHAHFALSPQRVNCPA
ncbi:hypothetical protein ['Paenibacillus yunnanensis' Narsing Rao et al. 2020]|uniref:hypothetical protein n=1 Tax=Paenibacillus tengchongensis TaxID=2608684 RepID=UPI00165270DC|nr:hypothetical protein [Paenibacillus tengchongensis]